MKKNQTAKIVLISVILSLAINIFFGRLLTAKISTLPFLNNWQILSPQAPIVIHTREEIRINETGDVAKVVNETKSKISTVILDSNKGLEVVGTAVNLTSDGLFLSLGSTVQTHGSKNLLIKLNDGRISPVTEAIEDVATDLVIFKTEFTGVPVADFGESSGLQAGEKILALGGSLIDYSVDLESQLVIKTQNNNQLQEFQADFPERAFQLQSFDSVVPKVLVNFQNEIVGIVGQEKVWSSDVVKNFADKFLSSNGELERLSFGFKYKPMSVVELVDLEIKEGSLVTGIGFGSPALNAGLKVSDIIISVNDQQLSLENNLERILETFKPREEVKFTVLRSGEEVELILTVGILN